MITALIISVWLIGAILFFAADGYYDFTNYIDGLIVMSLLWPIATLLVITYALREWFYRLRIKRDRAKETREKIRVAKQVEMEKLLLESEGEVERFVSEWRKQNQR